MKLWLVAISVLIVIACAPSQAQCTYTVTSSGTITGVGTLYCGLAQIIGTENLYCAKGAAPEMTEGTPLWGATDDIANLPTQCMYTGTDATPSPGNIYTPNSGARLTNVINSVGAGPGINTEGTTGGSSHFACGDTVIIDAGTTYTGEFVFPDLNCDGLHWITVKTSKIGDANFPLEGVRATPCIAGITNDTTNGRNLPGYPDYNCPSYPTNYPLSAKISQPANANAAAISFASGADHYRFIGIEFAKNPSVSVLQIVNLAVDGLTLGANHIIFDRSIVHGDQWTSASATTNEAGQGINAKNSQWIAEVNGWNYDTYCTSACSDSHAFAAGTGLYQDGPFKVYNSMLASAGQSWMFGGGGQGSGTPTTKNVEIRVNHIFKPLTWMVPINGCQPIRQAITKNSAEAKNLELALIEANFYENSWQGCQSDQAGFAQLFTPKNQNNQQCVPVTFDGSNMVTVAAAQTGCTGQSFTHHTASSPQSGNPIDATNCPPGGCVLNDDANNVDYRFCNGANGCDQSGIPMQCSGGVNAGNSCTANGQCPGSFCSPTTSARLTAAAPAAANVKANACVPGDCPDCKNRDITWRYNEVYNVTQGVQILTGLSTTCHDQASGMQRVSMHDNKLDGVDRKMSNGMDDYQSAEFLTISNNSLPPAVVSDVHVAHNTFGVSQGNQGGVSGFGNQIDRTDIQYLKGILFKDNVGPASFGMSRGSGTNVTKGYDGTGGLAKTYAVNSCQRYFTAEVPSGTVPASPAWTIQDFTFPGLPAGNANYFVSLNGQYTAITGQTPTAFHITATVKNGDTLVVRDLNECDWTFASNLLGSGASATFQGAGQDQAPYPNPNSCGAGNAQPCILDETAVQGVFTNNFQNWNGGRKGDYRFRNNSQYKDTASDAVSRAPTGKSPGADLDVLASKTAGAAGTAVASCGSGYNRVGTVCYPQLTISTTTLPAGSRNVPYNAALAASFGASQYWNGYKSWFIETDPANCTSGNCGSINNGTIHSGLVIGRDGIVNGPFVLLNVSRTGCPAACLSTYTISQSIMSPSAWEVGQTVVPAGMVNGTGATNDTDGTFNGTCVITAVGNNQFSCRQAGDIAGTNTNKSSHNPNTPKTCGVNANGFCDATASFAPISAGTYTFWVGARDGAFQIARKQISVVINP